MWSDFVTLCNHIFTRNWIYPFNIFNSMSYNAFFINSKILSTIVEEIDTNALNLNYTHCKMLLRIIKQVPCSNLARN